MAITAVVRYGETAVTPLLTVLQDVDADPGQRASAARALRLLFADKKVDARHETELSNVLFSILTRPERFVTVLSVLDLAATAGDARVTSRIAMLAEDAGASAIMDLDPAKRSQLQARAAAALAARKR